MNDHYEDSEPDLERLRRDPEGLRRDGYAHGGFAQRDQEMRYAAEARALPHAHRELTLSAGSILGLFFGLVILCGIFFGLGYNMHNHGATIIPGEGSTSAIPTANFSAFKPAAGLPAYGASAVRPGNANTTIAKPGNKPADAVNANPITVAPGAHEAVVAVAKPAATAQGEGILVQVAAISLAHRQDADLLSSTLRAKGYVALERQDSDNLIHVQVGPFATRAAAESVRQRLQSDGYSPYIK